MVVDQTGCLRSLCWMRMSLESGSVLRPRQLQFFLTSFLLMPSQIERRVRWLSVRRHHPQAGPCRGTDTIVAADLKAGERW